MSEIISSKNGRLHIYVRQDKYKGKLKSENWVGRTYHNGKQKVISSGTTNLDEAKVILEKWYDDLTSEKIQENTDSDPRVFLYFTYFVKYCVLFVFCICLPWSTALLGTLRAMSPLLATFA